MKRLLFFLMATIFAIQGWAQVAATLPYLCNFEDSTENSNWIISNSTCTNKWIIGSGVSNNDFTSKSLYISNDSQTNYYSTNKTSIVTATRKIVSNGATNYQLSFNFNCQGEAYDFVKVYIVPKDTNYVGATSSKYYATGSYSNNYLVARNGSNNYLALMSGYYTYDIPASIMGAAGDTVKLIFVWKNDSYGGSQPPAAIDNVSLLSSSCPSITQLSVDVSTITTNSALISWTSAPLNTSFTLEYKLDTQSWSQAIQQNQVTSGVIINGLNPTTKYNVRVKPNCSGTDGFWSNVSFYTMCPINNNLPFYEGFESTWKPSMSIGNANAPECWLNLNYGAPGDSWTPGSWTYSSYNPHSGSGAAEMFASSSDNDYLITPAITLTGNQYLRFWALGVSSSAPDTLAVGIYKLISGTDFTSLSDTSLLTYIMPNTQIPSDQFHEYEIDLSSYVGDYRIAFVRNTKGGYELSLDDVSIADYPLCRRPKTLAVNNVTTSSVDISFSPGQAGDASWYLYYKQKYAVSYDSISIFTNPYSLIGLTPSTEYVFFLKTLCGGSLSESTVPIEFKTNCGSISNFPWQEGFESNWASVALSPGNEKAPYCWLNFNGQGASGRWQKITSSSGIVKTGSGAAQMSTSYGVADNQNDWLISPLLTLTGNQTLRFWAKGENSYFFSGMDSLEVKIFNSTTASRDVLLSDTNSNLFVTIMPKTFISQTQYNEFEIDLSSFSGDCRIAFVRNHIGGCYLNIDDVKIVNNALCKRPLALNDTLLTATTATISFTPAKTIDNSWWIYYLDKTTNLLDSVITNSSISTKLTNLNPNTLYEYYIKTDCSSEISDASNSKIFRTLCLPISSLPYFETFDSYGADSYSNWNYCWNRYSDDMVYPELTTYQSFSPSASIYFNSFANGFNYVSSPRIEPSLALINQLRLKFKLYQPSQSLSSCFAEVGIMSNPNDTSSFVKLGTSITCTNKDAWEDKEISLASYTGNGQYITIKCGGGITQNFFYIDDILIDYLPQCAAPSALSAPIVGHNYSQLDWSKANLADSAWWIYHKSNGSIVWDSVYVKSKPYTITNLLPNTSYSFYIRTACGNDISDSSAIFPLKTKCAPITIPMNDSFDSYGGGYNITPTCWTTKTTSYYGYGVYPFIDTTYSFSPSGNLYFASEIGTYTIAVPPMIDSSISLDTLIVKFKIRNISSLTNGVRVGIMNNADDISTFVPIGNYCASKNTLQYEDIEVSLRNYSGLGRYVALLCEGDNGFSIDDFRIEYIPLCPKPIDLRVNNITTNSATIVWTSGNLGSNSWWLYYKDISATKYDSVFIQNNPTYTLTNLLPSTQYNYYVSTACVTTISTQTSTEIFYTSCLPISTFPWFEGFDSPWMTKAGLSNADQPTNCWININGGSNLGYMWKKSTNSRTGIGSLNLYAGGSYSGIVCDDYIITPVMNLTGNQKLNFWSKIGSNSPLENIFVKLFPVINNVDMNSLSDTTQFINIVSISDTNKYTWIEHEINLSQYIGDYRLVLARNNNIGRDYFIDDMTIGILPSCYRPLNVTSSNIQAHQVNISWTPYSALDNSWVIYYRTIGSSIWDSVVVSANTSYTLTSLFSDANYEIEIKTICQDGSLSDSRYGGTFITLCDPIVSFPYYDGFESTWLSPSGVSNAKQPTNCWININNGGDSYYCWQQTTSLSNIRTGFGAAQLYGDNSLMKAYLLSPVFTLNGNQKITFWTKGKSSTTTYPEHLWVKAFNVTSNGDFDSFSDTTLMTNLTFVSDTNQYTWKEYELNITGLTGNYRIVFSRDNNVGSSLYVDDFSVDNIPNCSRPKSLTVSNIGQTSADVSWVPASTNDNSWMIYYRKSGSQNWDSVASMINTTISLIGLSPITPYDIEIRTICGNGSYSDPRMGQIFRTTCGKIMSLPWSEDFDSYKNPVTGTLPDCWVRHTNYGQRPYVYNGSYAAYYGNGLYFYTTTGKYNMIVTPEFDQVIPINTLKLDLKFKSKNTTDTLRIGVMADTTFASWVEFAKITGPAVWQDYQVNFTNYTGNGKFVAFRVDNSCFAAVDNIVFSSNITCLDPDTLVASNITQTTADITWTAGGSENDWQIKLGNAGTPIDVQVTSYSFMNLTPNTQDTAYIRSSCGAGFYSNWIPLTFTTQSMPSNPAVTTSSITTITYNTAILVGSYVQGLDVVNAIGFEYKVDTATNWTNQAVSPVASPFSYNLTGLTPSTSYKVRAYATTNAGTFYGDTASFTTAVFNLPTVITDSIEILSNSSAKFYGSITTGTEQIVARGFEYKTSAQTWSQAQDLTAIGSNTITATATGLDTTTTYNVRAYAETGSGKVYGAEKNFVTTSGLSDIEINSISVSLYPNPANTKTTVCVRGIFERIEMEFVDMLGRTLKKFNLKSSNGEVKQVIEVGDLEKGIYYVRIKNNNKTISTQKLIIR